MSDDELYAEDCDLAERWRQTRDVEGHCGWPGGIIERSDEVAAELKRRGLRAPPADDAGGER